MEKSNMVVLIALLILFALYTYYRQRQNLKIIFLQIDTPAVRS
jgi:hypothetical protein